MASGAQAITPNLSRDEQQRGRQNVRHALRNFTSELLVFHNPKINLEEMDDLYDRPLDIVLLHRSKGLMGISIKSGEIVEESGDLVSQYQPHKEYYKIIDPIKQAQKAMIALLDACDPALKEFVPISIVVVYPDTHKSEFMHANPLFLFEEDLESDQLQQHLLDLYLESWDTEKALKYAGNATRIKEFLKTHSDNNIERVERKETLNKLGVREEKKAYVLPSKTAPGTVAAQAAKAAAVQPRVTTAAPPPRAVSLPPQAPVQQRPQSQHGQQKPAPNQRVQQKPSPQKGAAHHTGTGRMAIPPIKTAPRKRIDLSIEPQKNPLVSFFQDMEERWRYEERVALSGKQWGMVVACAAIFVCVAYFVGRNAGIIMRMH